MRTNVACAILAMLFIAGNATAQDAYLCIEDMATGFKYNEASKEWERTNFKSGDKYLLTRAKEDSVIKAKWELKRFGEDDSCGSYCEKDFNSLGNLWCRGLYNFSMNKNTNRFLLAYLVGYYQDNNPASGGRQKEGGDSPFIAIGKCSAL